MAGSVDSNLVMWTPGQIAERDGISKQAVSKTLLKLVQQHEVPVERDARGRLARVSLAHYDHHRGFFGNAAKTAVRHDDEDDGELVSSSRDEALRQQAWLTLGRQRIEHAERLGRLVRADLLADGLASAGRAIQSEIGRLQNKADDIALAVSKEGTSGARLMLRQMGTDLAARIADVLAGVASAAPAEDAIAEELDE